MKIYLIVIAMLIGCFIHSVNAKRGKKVSEDADKQREMEEIMAKLSGQTGGSIYTKEDLEDIRQGNFAKFQEKMKQKRQTKPTGDSGKESDNPKKKRRIEPTDEEKIEL